MRKRKTGPNASSEALLADLDKVAAQLAELLSSVAGRKRLALEAKFTSALQKALAQIEQERTQSLELRKLKAPPLTPEFRRWALKQINEKEVAKGLRELRGGGGLELRDFLPELRQLVRKA